ncbi:ABC transporter ATP-binding protein [Streptomyces sp. CB03911]|uniref:ABC transporter ATP-binding protein n=1 Tax=Streptomycetaceae TaxID=2062 RepID=UPI00093C62D3|nr:ABC transporter ATP-binding protein [Streptomyces sp. CB03911]OKI12090.1 ABC transporter ATP-binding protein [Streptomyces sp. CB03911]
MTELQPDSGPPALELDGLGKRYRRGWALRDCSLRLPAGRVCALVGPNGAGKSTLMAAAAHLLRPTEGAIRVLGRSPGDPAARARTAFVAQDKPLYRGFTVAELLRLGRELNPVWDRPGAEEVLAGGDVPLSARAGSLSGGQRTRVALALAVGKRPDLLVLDEPMADLDPLARQQVMGVLLAGTAERGCTVLMSSHVLAELHDACDYLVLLSGGRALLAGGIDGLVDAHRLLVGTAGPAGEPAGLRPHEVVETRRSGRRLTALVRPGGPVEPGWQITTPTLEDIVLAHLRSPGVPALLTDEARPARTAVTA